MAIYNYKAFNKSKKVVQGTVEANNEKIAATLLRERGYAIISVKEKTNIQLNNIEIFSRIKIDDIVVFSRQFSVMISANVAIVQALRIIADQIVNQKFKKIVSEIADEVDSGNRLSESLAKRPKVFSNFYISIIKSGETSGKLDEVLEYLADEMEKDYDMISKIKSAMIYPAVLFSLLIVIGAFMMIFVIPKMINIITESGAEVPWTTQTLIYLSDFLVNFWWLILLVVVLLVIAFKYYVKTARGKRNVDLIKLKLPIFGNLFRLIYVVRFSRSMSTLIIGGVTISKSLEISSEIVGNEIYRDLIKQTLKEVEDGNSISSIFLSSDVMPKMVPQMMSVGEKTGKLDLVLEKISDFYTREVNGILANLMSLIEPIIIVIMGLAVAVLVFAIMMPMYSMVGQF